MFFADESAYDIQSYRRWGSVLEIFEPPLHISWASSDLDEKKLSIPKKIQKHNI